MACLIPISTLVLATSSLWHTVGAQHPDGYRTDLDKGCWRVPAGRYGDNEEVRVSEFSVPKCTPQIPRNMCASCPLAIDNVDEETGNFINCGRMFEIDSPECKASLQQMVADTPCDTVLPGAYEKYYDPNASEFERDVAGQTLDRYVYTFCEQCCDCIPCGSTPESHALVDQRLDVTRYNCPLHFVFDVCAIYPDITYYGNVPYTYAATGTATGNLGTMDGAPAPGPALGPLGAGEDEESEDYAPPCGEEGECDALYLEEVELSESGYDTQGSEVAGILMCPLHGMWRRAVNSGDAERLAEIEATLNPILDYYMAAWGCGWEEAWQPCREMEARQGRMDPGHMNC